MVVVAVFVEFVELVESVEFVVVEEFSSSRRLLPVEVEARAIDAKGSLQYEGQMVHVTVNFRKQIRIKCIVNMANLQLILSIAALSTRKIYFA